jgi:hypothetical protein
MASPFGAKRERPPQNIARETAMMLQDDRSEHCRRPLRVI